MNRPRPSARGRGNVLRPAQDDHSPTPGASPVEKSRNRESAKSRLLKVGVQVDENLYFDLKKRAATERRKLYQLLNEAIARYLGQGGNHP